MVIHVCPMCNTPTGEGIIEESDFFMDNDANPQGKVECKCGWRGDWKNTEKLTI